MDSAPAGKIKSDIPGVIAPPPLIYAAGLAAGFLSHRAFWNWFGFPTPYIVVTILDISIGWTLAGLAIAKFADGKT